MEAVAQSDKEKKLETKKTAMQKFLTGFMKFLMMGGFLVIMVVAVAVMVLISYLTK